MAIDTVANCLLRLDVFRGLAAAQLARIAATADRMIFRDGHIIAKAGDAATGALILVHGQALAQEDGGHGRAPFVVETGSLIGENAMLTEHTYGATISAQGEVRAIRIARHALTEQMRADPALRDHFLRRVTSRLARVALELRLIDERLAAVCQQDDAASGL